MQRLNVVIADDESLVRQGITKFFKNSFPQINIALVASTGEEVLAALKSGQSFDIAVLDIRISNVTGLDISEYIYRNKLSTKVIIITGYREFDYARRALQYHVNSIVLKPIDFSELASVVMDVIAQLDLNGKETENSEKDFLINHEMNRLRFKKLFDGSIDIPQYEQLLYFEKNVNFKRLVLIRLKLENSSMTQTDVVWKWMAEYKSNGVDIYYISQFDVIVTILLVIYNTDDRIENIVQWYSEKLKHDMAVKYGVEFSFEFSSYDSVESIFNNSKDENESNDARIEKILSYINDNYSQDITLESISAKFYLNSSYFSRWFKQMTGFGFVDYLTDVRIKKAKELLKTNSYTIPMVADMVGYKNLRYFNKIFTKKAGISPRQYIVKH